MNFVFFFSIYLLVRFSYPYRRDRQRSRRVGYTLQIEDITRSRIKFDGRDECGSLLCKTSRSYCGKITSAAGVLTRRTLHTAPNAVIGNRHCACSCLLCAEYSRGHGKRIEEDVSVIVSKAHRCRDKFISRVRGT